MNAGEDLAAYGVAVVPLLDAAARARWERALWAAADEFPEYVVTGRDARRVLGGFGAWGNPASFHHPTVRAFRRVVKRALVDALREYAREVELDDDVAAEMLFDRMCVRYDPFLSPSAESWHRDVYDGDAFRLRALPRTLRGGTARDQIFGGWTNLDERDQAFVGLVGTHDETFATASGGFAVFDERDVARLGFDARLRAQAGWSFGATIATNERGEVVVPPGHAIVFRQDLVHAVKSGPQPRTPALRVFHGVRLTREAVPLFEDLDAVLADGAVPRIPSGQLPPMFSKNHYAQFGKADGARWREWGARTFRPACLYERTTNGHRYWLPGGRERSLRTARAMPSLAAMGLHDARFEYSAADRAALWPERLWPENESV